MSHGYKPARAAAHTVTLRQLQAISGGITMAIALEQHRPMEDSMSQRPNGSRVLRMQREILLHPESRVIKLSIVALGAVAWLSGRHAAGAGRNAKFPGAGNG
jgi:hypothetical protein